MSAVPEFPPPKTDKPRPHVCATCARSFARPEHLNRHERSHTKERPFECPSCTRRFTRRDLLLRHQQKLHSTTAPPSKSIHVDTSALGLTACETFQYPSGSPFLPHDQYELYAGSSRRRASSVHSRHSSANVSLRNGDDTYFDRGYQTPQFSHSRAGSVSSLYNVDPTSPGLPPMPPLRDNSDGHPLSQSPTFEPVPYLCTYDGCHQLFDTILRLKQHKLRDHRVDVTSTNDYKVHDFQAGAYRCERDDPTTGKRCNFAFSRPHNLAAHDFRTHNAGNPMFNCYLHKEEKTFSCNDALVEHLREVHSEARHEPTRARSKGRSRSCTPENESPNVAPRDCYMCGDTISIRRKRDWQHHVLQDLEPYQCMEERCESSDVTYARLGLLRKHYLDCHSEAIMVSTESWKCIFCEAELAENMNLAERFRHVGRHMEELAFAVVPHQYEDWQFYSDHGSADAESMMDATRAEMELIARLEPRRKRHRTGRSDTRSLEHEPKRARSADPEADYMWQIPADLAASERFKIVHWSDIRCHLRRGVVDGHWACSWPGCNVQFEKSVELLPQHIGLDHIGIRPYKCSSCAATFGKFQDVIDHSQLHLHDCVCGSILLSDSTWLTHVTTCSLARNTHELFVRQSASWRIGHILSGRVSRFLSPDDGWAVPSGIEARLVELVTQLYGDPTKRSQCYAEDGFVVYIKSLEELRVVVKYPISCSNCLDTSRCLDGSLPCKACVRGGCAYACTLRIPVAVKAEKILPVTMGDGETALNGGTRSTPTSRVCANCKRSGHIMTNKKVCPLLNGQAEQQLRKDLDLL